MLLCIEERGQSLTEYALVLVFVFLVVIAIVTIYGTAIGNLYSRVTSQMP